MVEVFLFFIVTTKNDAFWFNVEPSNKARHITPSSLVAKKHVFNIILQPILQIDNSHNIQDFLCKELLVKFIN